MSIMQRFVGGVAALEAMLFTVVSVLALGGISWFRPAFRFGTEPIINGKATLSVGQLDLINEMAVMSTAKAVIALLLFAVVHALIQHWLTRNRPSGEVIHPGWGKFDLITSILPFFGALMVFLISRAINTFDEWWFWLQLAYLLTIFCGCIEDIIPTWTYYRANRLHIFKEVKVEPAAPAARPAVVRTPSPAPANDRAPGDPPATTH